MRARLWLPGLGCLLAVLALPAGAATARSVATFAGGCFWCVETAFEGLSGVASVTPAEEYHQDFYEKNPARYQAYRLGCGRDRRLRELWGDAAGGHR